MNSLPRITSTGKWRASAAWGVIGDWAHPYKTMDKAFEAEEVKIFGAMYRKGLHLQGPEAGVLVSQG